MRRGAARRVLRWGRDDGEEDTGFSDVGAARRLAAGWTVCSRWRRGAMRKAKQPGMA